MKVGDTKSPFIKFELPDQQRPAKSEPVGAPQNSEFVGAVEASKVEGVGVPPAGDPSADGHLMQTQRMPEGGEIAPFRPPAPGVRAPGEQPDFKPVTEMMPEGGESPTHLIGGPKIPPDVLRKLEGGVTTDPRFKPITQMMPEGGEAPPHVIGGPKLPPDVLGKLEGGTTDPRFKPITEMMPEGGESPTRIIDGPKLPPSEIEKLEE